jgi:hypothetical protein
MNKINKPKNTKEYFKQIQEHSIQFKELYDNSYNKLNFLTIRGFSRNEAFDIMYSNK